MSGSDAEKSTPAQQLDTLGRRVDELHRELRSYRTLVEGAGLALAVVVDRRPVWVNQAFCDLLGYADAAEILALASVEPLIALHERERLLGYFQARMAGREAPSHYSSEALRKDGRVIPVHKQVHRVEWEGRPAVLVAVQGLGRAAAAPQEPDADAAHWRIMVAESPAPVIVVGYRGGTLLYCNEAYRQLIGLKDAATPPPPISEVVPDTEERTRLARRVRSSGQVETLEMTLRTVSGELREVMCSARMIDYAGEPALLACFMGLTALGDVRRELRSNRQILQSVVDTLPYQIFVKNTARHYLMANRAFYDFFGVTAERLSGQDLGEVLSRPQEERDSAKMLDLRVLSENRMIVTQFERTSAAGVVRHFRNIRTPLRDEQGAVIGLVGISEDITERMAAERELRQLKSTLDMTKDSVFIFDPSTLRFTYVNQAAMDQVGHPREELLRMTLLDILPSFDEPRFRQLIEPLLNGLSASVTLETVARRMQHWQMPAELTLQFITPPRESPRFIAVLRDISERRAIEEQLRQSQKMEAVGQLTGGIAHDFNNLLAIIIGNLQFLVDEIDGGKDTLDLAQKALGAAERGAQLTQHLLAFARRQPLQPVPINMNTMITEISELLRSTLGERIEVETVLAGGIWPTLADPQQLENAILNLALNARDAMPQGGKLTIETGNARLDEEYAVNHTEVTPGQYVLLAISDTGPGMTPDVMRRAFDPFFTTKDVGYGSGLGLSMVYGFVKQSKGHVKIYSELGQGTTVKIYLPRNLPQGPVSAPASQVLGEPRGERQTVLVVEDEPAVRRMNLRMLTELGYHAMAAADAATALEVLRGATEVDLLFTDVVLPGGMSGVALAAEAKRLRPALKVLFTSGYTENAIIHRGELMHEELIQKPYRRDELARRVQKVLSKSEP
ncbi:MAG: PAS domain S-box protein [Candidatus Lambdaproteobacteria bacterium]|nr:PAS domain S-box protein [Candidatus Lambdaproteobacteria bacterium]